MATVHFISNYGRNFKDTMELAKWLVTSIDAGQWTLILSTIGTGRIVAHEQGTVDVCIARHVKSGTECLHVNRTPGAIVGLGGVEGSAGRPAVRPTCLSDGTKIIFYVLVHVPSDSDFLPAMTKCCFLVIRDLLPEGLPRESFSRVMINQVDGYFEVNEDGVVKITALAY